MTFKIFDRAQYAQPWCIEGINGDNSYEKKIKAKLKIIDERYCSSDLFFLSFPKSGRTWVRTVVANYLSARYDIPMDLEFLTTTLDYGRRPCFSHNFFDVFRYIEQPLEVLNRRKILEKPLVVLVRDPRDVCSSYFHHIKNRDRLWTGGAFRFTLDPIYGVKRQVEFVGMLLDLYEQHKGPKLLLSYEDMRRNPIYGFNALLGLIEKSPVDLTLLSRAIQDCSFEKMQQQEINLSTEGKVAIGSRLGIRDWDGSVDSLKVRRGVIGAFYTDFGRLGGIFLTLRPSVLRIFLRIRASRRLLGKVVRPEL